MDDLKVWTTQSASMWASTYPRITVGLRSVPGTKEVLVHLPHLNSASTEKTTQHPPYPGPLSLATGRFHAQAHIDLSLIGDRSAAYRRAVQRSEPL
jgi:hypothetical protein